MSNDRLQIKQTIVWGLTGGISVAIGIQLSFYVGTAILYGSKDSPVNSPLPFLRLILVALLAIAIGWYILRRHLTRVRRRSGLATVGITMVGILLLAFGGALALGALAGIPITYTIK